MLMWVGDMRKKKKFFVDSCKKCPACFIFFKNDSVIYKCVRESKEVPSEGILKDCDFIKIVMKKKYNLTFHDSSPELKKERYCGKGRYYNNGRELILLRMKEKEITAPEMAKRLGVTKAYFYRFIKTSYHYSDNPTIKKICDILEIDEKEGFPSQTEDEKIKELFLQLK